MAEIQSPTEDKNKNSPMQSYKDMRLELIKTADNNAPLTPLDKRRNNKRAGIQKDLSMEVIVPENYQVLEKKKNYHDIKFIITCLKNHFVFYNLQDNQLETLVNEMFYCQLNENDFIIHEDDNASSFFILENFTVDQKNSVAGVLIDQKFQKDQLIVRENDPASSFYIIKEGQVSVMKEGAEVRVLSSGDSFGESALLQGTQKRVMSIQAKCDVKCLALGRDVLNRILGDQVEMIIYKNISKWSLERLEGFQGLNKLQKDKLLDSLIITHLKDNDIIATKGTLVKNSIIILLEGQLKRGGQITAQKGHVIGDKEAFAQNDRSVFMEDLLISGDQCITGSIKTDQLESIFGETLRHVLDKNKQVLEQTMLAESTLKSQIADMKLSDLICLKKLGFGQFGSVFLVKEKNKKKLYGLKCVSKEQVVEQSLEKHIQNEKLVMEFNDFPFVMKFLRSFKDERCIYFLLEFIQGMELFDVIREIGLLSTVDSQFYIGSLILAMEYLHSNHIIYRDIKPENIMVDDKGYLKLIDMGTAKIMKSKVGTMTRTFTIIGTPHYMAPEVISGKGYNFLVDLWSIGICLYEFMCGYVPFAEEAEDPYEIYETIIKEEIKFPNYMKDAGARHFMLQLLSKIPEIRLGGSYNALKANNWFKTFEWHTLLENQIKAPWIPPVESQMKDDVILKLERTAKTMAEQIIIEGIQPLSSAKTKNPKYDPKWEDIF